MPNFFKKLSSGASNVFKKIDSGASNVFKKLPDQVNSIAGKVSSGLTSVGGQIAGVAKQTGNILEKNAGIASDVAAGGLLATGFGAPLAASVLAGGNTLQQLGGRIKQGGQNAQNDLNRLATVTQQQTQSNVSNFRKQANQSAVNTRQAVNQSADHLRRQALDKVKGQHNNLVAKMANNLTLH